MLTGAGGELPKSGASIPEKGNDPWKERFKGIVRIDEAIEKFKALIEKNNSHSDPQQPSKDDD